MRAFLVLLNGFIAAFFLVAFGFTFFGKEMIQSAARDFATTKTASYAAPAVAMAEQAAGSRVVRTILTNSQEMAIAAEFDEYHADPGRYVANLTGKVPRKSLRLPNHPLVAKIVGWKNGIRGHYDKVLGRILGDLRIFAGTNCLAAAIACGFAWRAGSAARVPLLAVSAMLLAATLFCVCYYIERFSFFRIMSDSFVGWWYPGLLVVTFGWLLNEVRQKG